MDATMYRRRVSGRGSRVAGKRRNGALAEREKRRLLQLAASLFLFLLVFLGRGAFPEQMDALRDVLNSDLDLSYVREAFSKEEGSRTALEWLAYVLEGERTEAADTNVLTGQEVAESLSFPMLPSYFRRVQLPVIDGETSMEESAEPPAQKSETSASPEEEEPVVTASAQLYSPTGETLPERVSFEYYNLGLKETAVPVMGNVSSGFGFRNHPVSGDYSFHTAVDVAVDVGTEILAFSDGTVRYIGENNVFGLYLKIDHDNGVSTFYAHCDELLVKKGERVIVGQVVALSGETGNATGPHLHFSLEKDGIRLDPEHYLEFVR